MASTNLFLIWLVYFQASLQGTSAIFGRPVLKSRSTSNTGFVNEKIPKECEAMGYCEVATSHPRELVARLVREVVEARVPLDSDVNDTNPLVNNRFSSSDNGESSCNQTDETITPFLLKDMTDGNWYYTLNTKENPIQKYKVQICAKSSPGEAKQECSKEIIFDDDYNTQCIQKNMIRRVLVMKDNKPHPILASFPCCCSCVAIDKYQ